MGDDVANYVKKLAFCEFACGVIVFEINGS